MLRFDIPGMDFQIEAPVANLSKIGLDRGVTGGIRQGNALQKVIGNFVEVVDGE